MPLLYLIGYLNLLGSFYGTLILTTMKVHHGNGPILFPVFNHTLIVAVAVQLGCHRPSALKSSRLSKLYWTELLKFLQQK